MQYKRDLENITRFYGRTSVLNTMGNNKKFEQVYFCHTKKMQKECVISSRQVYRQRI